MYLFYSCRRHPHTPIQRRHGRENGECVWVVRFCSARRMASPACASAAMLKGSCLACFRGGVKNGDRHTRACIGIYICEHKTALAGMEGTCIWLILCLHFGLRLVENSVRLFMVAQLVSEPLAPYFVVTLFPHSHSPWRPLHLPQCRGRRESSQVFSHREHVRVCLRRHQMRSVTSS